MQPDNDSVNDQPQPMPAEARDNGAEAAANLTREQLNDIYAKQATAEQQPADEPPQQTAYTRSHSSAHEIRANQWQQYHSAWQNYYQQYYERYYVGEVHRARKALSEHAAGVQQQPTSPESAGVEEGTISTDEAMYDLRAQLLGKVQESAKKVRKSRHFIPAVSALSVLLLFIFLQYNRVIIANVQAYVTPGNIDPQNIIVDPNASIHVSKASKLIIPKINVDVPVDYNARSDYDSQMAAMKNGVAYFGIAGADSKPGELGNVPIAGHSSNDFIDTGNYKFVFALLSRMKKGDTFYLHYGGIRYTYTVTRVLVVKPDDISRLQVGNKKPMATLITCTPLGTATNRLLVFGEQISPDPANAKRVTGTSQSTASMPGNSPTFLQRIFGGGEG